MRSVVGQTRNGAVDLPCVARSFLWLALLSLAGAADLKPADPKDTDLVPERPITPEERRFWAFQPPRRAALASVPELQWTENPIDLFVLAPMRSKGLQRSPQANLRTLIRRASLDLLGSPPTPEEIEAFLGDSSPDAWERCVDRLLASPHYGERWARHWLDLARYADSGGFEFDRDRREAWRYRDYVVKSFNEDKPYDRFIREQLAGDEYASPSDETRAEAMIATGFMRLGPSSGGGKRRRQESLDDILTTTTLTFLGLTVGCARCHDHKTDPIPQKDYYRLQAVFFPTRSVNFPLVSPAVVDAYEAEVARLTGLERPLKRQLRQIEAPYVNRLVEAAVRELPDYLQVAWRTPENERTEGQRLNVAQIKKALANRSSGAKITTQDILALMSAAEERRHRELKEQLAELAEQKPQPYSTAMAVGESGREPEPSYFLHRGSVDARGPEMTPGTLSVLCDTDDTFRTPPAEAQSSWRRRGFAEWLVSADHPLTARVMVNRIWQHHFGEGIVRTPSNFGQLGDRPSHPELLDWLALEFIRRGWSIKAMHRLMMTSRAYQMASDDISANGWQSSARCCSI